MTDLENLQRRMAAIVMQPLTGSERMRRKTSDGVSVNAEAQALIKPNRVLTSFERLEIYNRQYWFRVLSSFAEDFPGLRAVLGGERFEGLMRAYLKDCPSRSFTLRNLGSDLESWLTRHAEWTEPRSTLALDVVRLEWAHIEAFDGAQAPLLTPADVESAGLTLRVSLQPYVRLLELTYPVDDLLIEVHDHEAASDTSSNAARQHRIRSRVRRYTQPEPERIYLAVHRIDDSIYYKRLQQESFRMLEALGRQAPLEEAINVAFEDSLMPEEQRVLSIQQSFSNWAELGWLCRPKATSFSNS